MSGCPDWNGKHYAFFQNRECECFPCHGDVPEGSFNCLFCYCPLYALGKDCGGCFTYTDSGIKDCSGCSVPHRAENYGYVLERIRDVQKLTRKK